MKEYLMSVILISAAIGICEALAPVSEGIGRYVRYIGLLCILAAVISPIAKGISKIGDGSFDDLRDSITEGAEDAEKDHSEKLKEYLRRFSENEYKAQIGEMLEEMFGVPRDESTVVLTLGTSESGACVKRIQILLEGRSIFKNPYKIEEYFSSLTGAECQVLIRQE